MQLAPVIAPSKTHNLVRPRTPIFKLRHKLYGGGDYRLWRIYTPYQAYNSSYKAAGTRIFVMWSTYQFSENQVVAINSDCSRTALYCISFQCRRACCS